MPKYRVVIEELCTYTREVEAESEDAAQDMAEQMFLASISEPGNFECEVHERDVEATKIP